MCGTNTGRARLGMLSANTSILTPSQGRLFSIHSRAAGLLPSKRRAASVAQKKSRKLKKFLLCAFSSMIHLCTNMMPVGNPAPSNHYTFFSSPGWTQHSYWSAPQFMEQNVWDKFEGAVTGNQGIINAKNESNELLGDVKVTNDWKKYWMEKRTFPLSPMI